MLDQQVPVVKQKVESKINLIEDSDATGEIAKAYDEWRAESGRQQVRGILTPDFLRQVMAFSNTIHFSEGHLDRKTKEAIASYVSYLLSVLTGRTCLLPACSGSDRQDGGRDRGGRPRQCWPHPGGTHTARLRAKDHRLRRAHDARRCSVAA
jgi:hypothetical protein